MISVVRQVWNLARQYGGQVLNWVRNNTQRIWDWARDGLAADAIIQRIREILGLD